MTSDVADVASAGGVSPRGVGLLRSCLEALLGPSASKAAVAMGIAASKGLNHDISNLLIKDAMRFLAPFGEAQRRTVIDDAIDRLISTLGNFGTDG